MKEEILIIGFCIFFVFGIGFFVFGITNGFTGFIIYDENNNIITEEIALQAINESEQIILDMQKNNFSILYINDSLIEAKRIFEQVRYAEILRDENSTEYEKLIARNALSLIDWKDIYYSDVLVYTDEIKQRKETAFLLRDKLIVAELKINEEISNETRQIFENAKIAFEEDRYEEAESLIGEFKIAFENEKAEETSLRSLQKGAKNFFQRYWIFILILLIIFGIAMYFVYRKLEKRLLKRKIRKNYLEKKTLRGLMKKTQTARFKENTISEFVYNIRMKKYKEKLQEIKQDLPVMEKRLEKLNKGKLILNKKKTEKNGA